MTEPIDTSAMARQAVAEADALLQPVSPTVCETDNHDRDIWSGLCMVCSDDTFPDLDINTGWPAPYTDREMYLFAYGFREGRSAEAVGAELGDTLVLSAMERSETLTQQ